MGDFEIASFPLGYKRNSPSKDIPWRPLSFVVFPISRAIAWTMGYIPIHRSLLGQGTQHPVYFPANFQAAFGGQNLQRSHCNESWLFRQFSHTAFPPSLPLTGGFPLFGFTHITSGATLRNLIKTVPFEVHIYRPTLQTPPLTHRYSRTHTHKVVAGPRPPLTTAHMCCKPNTLRATVIINLLPLTIFN